MGHVSTRWTGSRWTPAVPYEKAGGTPVSRGVGVAGRGPLSGWTDSARAVGRMDGRRIRVRSGVGREHIWSWPGGESLSGGG